MAFKIFLAVIIVLALLTAIGAYRPGGSVLTGRQQGSAGNGADNGRSDRKRSV